ncbi:hypothetical protein PsorP6_003870 [Peronosclerospora sorghi]|uniref:Uncharacterized protein n=1 Tax=Peronosclerospora sorghi TaxID=230839 RepID=A0ACC0VPJ2_9STRA|nr:hypothetical protein PsorP6_003870 [Peronosclerospora sorghi]
MWPWDGDPHLHPIPLFVLLMICASPVCYLTHVKMASAPLLECKKNSETRFWATRRGACPAARNYGQAALL